MLTKHLKIDVCFEQEGNSRRGNWSGVFQSYVFMDIAPKKINVLRAAAKYKFLTRLEIEKALASPGLSDQVSADLTQPLQYNLVDMILVPCK